MKPAGFQFHVPRDIEECTRLLAEHGDNAVVIAGGQSLIPLMRFRLAQPEHVISLRGIPSLQSIRRDKGVLSIGARTTYSAIQRSPEVAAACPAIPKAIELVATPAVRARGTLCGNLVNADPASELPAVALMMSARMRLRSEQGERVVEASEFFEGPYMTARRSDELLVEVEFPERPQGEVFAIREVSRLIGGFPLAGVAVALTHQSDDKLRDVIVACFGVNGVQLRIPQAEALLQSQPYSPATIAAAADAIDAAIEPHADPFGSVEYRRSATRTLFERVLLEAYRSRSVA